MSDITQQIIFKSWICKASHSHVDIHTMHAIFWLAHYLTFHDTEMLLHKL